VAPCSRASLVPSGYHDPSHTVSESSDPVRLVGEDDLSRDRERPGHATPWRPPAPEVRPVRPAALVADAESSVLSSWSAVF